MGQVNRQQSYVVGLEFSGFPAFIDPGLKGRLRLVRVEHLSQLAPERAAKLLAFQCPLSQRVGKEEKSIAEAGAALGAMVVRLVARTRTEQIRLRAKIDGAFERKGTEQLVAAQ